MDSVEVSTLVYLPPEEVYDFLIDFPRYADYSKYLKEVRMRGDGTPGTEYDLTFAWWKLTYTANSRVTDVERPERIDWKLTEDIDARGHWAVEHVPEEAPEGVEDASRVRFYVEFAPGSADASAISLPAFVSLGWVIEKVRPKIIEEAERVVERIVADLEGERRPVELVVHDRPDAV
ncbi:type II toxin-antitoxin system RatA family toxin [Halomarina ordinaria]|uniref:Type II toxin-antitoxin system RatA family toxin n=1 Tax=Halomarina ordinaria TaxID=3033939 RepID=A0ABD5UBW6_9EURY|nr:SRPBCC family protein [Halomarina sp. PSRA2]